MVHAGAAFIDIVPHGNYFLAGKDSMKVSMADRMKVIPYETIVGGVMTAAATIMYGFILA
jgi:GntP family gluconate:H+ symporter